MSGAETGPPFLSSASGPESLADHLLDTEHVVEVVGVAFSINRPTRDASNPIFGGGGGETWDADKAYPTALKDGATWLLFYNGGNGTFHFACLAESVDGITWTKPVLGIETIDGSNANNALNQAVHTAALYDDVDDVWVLVAEDTSPAGGGNDGVRIYTSATPDAVPTLVKHLNPSGYAEGKEVYRLPDGRWVALYVAGHASQRRSISAYRSDSTALGGSWTHIGEVFTSTDQDRQYYTMGVERVGDQFYGFLAIYNKTAETIDVELWTSRDGLSWSLLDADWLPLGSGGAWDDSIVKGPFSIVEDGDDWQMYYEGWPVTHDTAFPRDRRVGRVTIERGRVGSVTGTGSFITTPIDPAAGILTVNSSAGAIDVEVLDALTGLALPGFEAADFDGVSGDDFEHVCTWGGLPLPTGAVVQLKFVLTAATMHSYDAT